MKTSMSLLICSLVFFLADTSSALECTEADLKDVKLTAKSLRKLPADKQVKILHAFLDDLKASNEDLAVALEAESRKLTSSDAKAAKLLFHYWCTIIRLYPEVEQLKVYVEYDLQLCSEVGPPWYKYLPLVTKSFVKALGEQEFLNDQQTKTWNCCFKQIADKLKPLAEEVNAARLEEA